MSKTISSDRFIDNPALLGREAKFIALDIKVAPVLASWQESIFAHEWLASDGQIKKMPDMTAKVQERRAQVETLIQSNTPLERPVLGIGILDNVEIGAGKDIFLCLAAMGLTTIPVHIPKSHEHDFRMFIR